MLQHDVIIYRFGHSPVRLSGIAGANDDAVVLAALTLAGARFADCHAIDIFPSSVATHRFETSGHAYDACQCDDTIKKGDILVIEAEQVIGIADTWPVAVTLAQGHLHRPADGVTLASCLDGRFPSISETIASAKSIAEQHGWAVRQ